jgi:hypothetical protein
MYDAMRCAMNFGMDYYLFGADSTREIEMATRIINFFERTATSTLALTGMVPIRRNSTRRVKPVQTLLPLSL